MHAIDSYIRHTLLQAGYAQREAAWLSRIVCNEMLGQSLTDYYAGKDMTLSVDERHKLDNILARLLKFEPIQYVQGQAGFWGRIFRVTPDVLIPRPETEELVELMLAELDPDARVLDIGTGSGCIAVTLSCERPAATVVAWDISEEALAVARGNNAALRGRVTFERRNVLEPVPSDGFKEKCYDVIVSNPPYVCEAERAAMERNVTDWEPFCALFVPDDDPLRFYRHIAQLGRMLLVAGGKLYLEINQAFGQATVALLNDYGYRNTIIRKDMSGNDRFVTAEK